MSIIRGCQPPAFCTEWGCATLESAVLANRCGEGDRERVRGDSGPASAVPAGYRLLTPQIGRVEPVTLAGEAQMATTTTRPLGIFVSFIGCLTDHEPQGEGLISFSLLDGLARRGHDVFTYTPHAAVQNADLRLHVRARRQSIPADSLAGWEHLWHRQPVAPRAAPDRAGGGGLEDAPFRRRLPG